MELSAIPFGELVRNSNFWFSTVLIGLTLSVIGTYATRALDFLGRKSYEQFSEANKTHQATVRAVISLLASDAEFRSWQRERVRLLRHWSIFLSVSAVFVMVAPMGPPIAAKIFGFALFFTATMIHGMASSSARMLLRSYEERHRERANPSE